MHREVGFLNYLSNSNLDYNDAMNMRRFGAYAGIALHQNPQPKLMQFDGSFAGLVVNEMGGIIEDVQDQVMAKPLLWSGLAVLSYPHIAKVTKSKKLQVSAKTQQQMMLAGVGLIVAHFVKPMLMGE